MIQWLQNYSGIKSSGENIEQTELENLRKEVKRYKKKYEKEDKEMEVSSESDEDITPEEQKRIDEEMKKSRIKFQSCHIYIIPQHTISRLKNHSYIKHRIIILTSRVISYR